MKKPKGKTVFPRRQWQLNPVTRVKPSAKVYARPRQKQKDRGAAEAPE